MGEKIITSGKLFFFNEKINILEAAKSHRNIEGETYYWKEGQGTAGAKNPWRSDKRICQIFCWAGNELQVS